MSILSDFERRLERAVEGLFAGAFRSPVQPAEVAKALGRSMDDGRRVGVEKVYVPTSYTVAVSAEDAKELGSFRDTLAGELSTYLIAHAQNAEYHLTERPRVHFEVANDLKLGRFHVKADSEPPRTAEDVAPSTDHEITGPTAEEIAPEPLEARRIRPPSRPVTALSTVTVSDIDHDVALKGERMTIGRLSECGICLNDANASRQHAAFVLEDGEWWLVDLGSTNGTTVNASRIERHRLQDGDSIQIGVTQLVYHGPKG